MITPIVLSILFNVYVIWRTFKSQKINSILKVSVLFYSTMWLIVPGIGMIFVGDDATQFNLVTPDYVTLYALEIVLFGTALLTFLYLEKIPKYQKPTIKTKTFYFFSIFYFLTTINNIFYGSHDYLLNNDILETTSSVYSGTFVLLYNILGGMFTYVAIQSNKKKLQVIAVILILLTIISNVLTGARIGMVWLLFLIMARLYESTIQYSVGTKLTSMLSRYLLIFILFLGMMGLSSTIASFRASESVGVDNIAMSNVDATSMIEDLSAKFNSTTAGIQLINGYGAGAAGISPYWGSFLFFVPRFIYPDKPISGSIDNTYFGTPARLVPALINSQDTINNVGVSPLAISVWHWGWLAGTIIIWLTALLNFYLINFLLNNNSLLLKSLGIYIIPIPGFLNIFQSPDVVIKHVVFALLCIILVKYFPILTKSKKRTS